MKEMDPSTVLEQFRQWVDRTDQPSLRSVLEMLAKLYGADQVGVMGMDATSPECIAPLQANSLVPFPWQTTSALLDDIGAALGAVQHEDATGHWLVSSVWEPNRGPGRLMWLRRPPGQRWSEAERWSWFAASQALGRWLGQTANTMAATQAKLEQAAAVTAKLSHDFGNYLTGILGFTELSMTQVAADSLLHRYLQEVLQSAKQGAEWIRRLHLFCRRSSAPTWPALLPIVLASEQQRVRATGGTNLTWQAEASAELPLLALDTAAAQTVVAELVNNARDAMKDQGTICFRAQEVELKESECRRLLGGAKPGRYVELTVTDSGPGIAPAIRANLLREIFFSTKPRHRGLGLLIVYGILRFGGGFHIEDAASGPGTRLRVYFPVAAIEGPTAANPGPHVFLVHANPVIFESMRRLLEAVGYRVSVGLSPQAVLTMVSTPGQAFDLIVMEATMPTMSGFDLARRVLERDRKANFLFVHTQQSMQGLAEEELLQRFKLLRSPLQPPGLLQSVQAALTKDTPKS